MPYADFWQEIALISFFICIFAAIKSWKSGVFMYKNGWKSDAFNL